MKRCTDGSAPIDKVTEARYPREDSSSYMSHKEAVAGGICGMEMYMRPKQGGGAKPLSISVNSHPVTCTEGLDF